jgi:hypothetical protein
MIPDGISFDITNAKFRQFKSGDDILEYTFEGGEITVDWVSGKGASSMMRSILDADGAGVTKISGYVTDKLGGASNAVLQPEWRKSLVMAGRQSYDSQLAFRKVANSKGGFDSRRSGMMPQTGRRLFCHHAVLRIPTTGGAQSNCDDARDAPHDLRLAVHAI